MQRVVVKLSIDRVAVGCHYAYPTGWRPCAQCQEGPGLVLGKLAGVLAQEGLASQQPQVQSLGLLHLERV